jgi:ribonucleoside-diphosphate reductase alpha chain
MMEKVKSQVSDGGILPTPAIPDGLDPVILEHNARQVLMRRYVRHDQNGEPIETVEGMFWRVAYHVALSENEWGGEVFSRAKSFYDLLTSKRFFPNSPTFTGAGTQLGQLAACFVLPISDDMGRNQAGIFQTLRDAALIQQTGGGNGFSFSRLRPKGTIVKKSAGYATGPVGFLKVYDKAFGEIAQGGTRRGANMAVLRIDHPDIEDFITCKSDEDAITNFNISIGITDAFIEAVKADQDWDLCFPDVEAPGYKGFYGTLEQAKARGIPIKTHKTVRARDLFNKIVQHSHHNGEPGVLYLDHANNANPLKNLYQLEATNPCGEQWLGPYENCCLGSVNLAQHLGENGSVDWDLLEQSVTLATIFLDDVVEANAYVPAVPQLRESALRARRIGLGIMGLADLMYHVGVRYGSEEGQEFAAQVMEFVRYQSMITSIDLAEQRGPFPAIKGSVYDPNNLVWQIPQPLMPYQQHWDRPEVDWNKVLKGIRQHGIRNAAQTTIAPTGTIATVAGCEGYGCEPVFALAYVRHVNDNGKDLELSYTSPKIETALVEAGFEEAEREEIYTKIMETGTCQDIQEIPQNIRDIFVVSQDINAEEHVQMQAALQAFVDNSLSKTINFPAGVTEDEVAKAYLLAWELGCKGITVYVTGSRNKVVLETKATKKEKTETKHSEIIELDSSDLLFGSKKPRPISLHGVTLKVSTPMGKAFVTINENGGRQPFEVFINTAKAGSDTAAVSEAIGRLISYILRLSSSVEPRQRLQEIWRQLSGIGGGRSLGFGPNRVRSLPDGVARALEEYLESENPISQKNDNNPKHLMTQATGEASEDKENGNGFNIQEETARLTGADLNLADDEFGMKIGDLCPECGQAALVNEEGCRKCYACGYSEC